MSRIQSDLKIVFGFSAENAQKAEDLWRAGKLPEVYNRIMNSLLAVPWGKEINPAWQRTAPDKIFTEFNHKLTTGEL